MILISALASGPNDIGGTYLFAGTPYGNYYDSLCGGVYLSTNNGTSWSEASSDSRISATALAVGSCGTNGTYIFAGTSSYGVWKRPLMEMITSVPSFASNMPHGISLAQNYPNPFNPTTSIGFRVSGLGSRWVRLAVYDLLGREVAVLVDEEKPPGNHEVQFDASKLSSGVYFYRMQAGIFAETRRMMLVK
jgi:hypothetical protein